MLMQYIRCAPEGQRSELVAATMMQGMECWGTTPPPKWHYNPNSSTNLAQMNAPQFHPPWNGNWGDRADLVGTGDVPNKATAYSRALRKSCLLNQRGYLKARRNRSDSADKLRHHQSRQRRAMSNLECCQKDAERHLPFLAVREGITMSLMDYHTGQYWTARYRYWPNNKSRMYLLEKIGSFVSFHKLEEGDLLLCYRNPQGAYVIRGRRVAAEAMSSPRREPSPDRAQAKETATRPVVLESYKDECNSTGSSDASNPSFDTPDSALEELLSGKDVSDCMSGLQDFLDGDLGITRDWQGEKLGGSLVRSFQPPLLDLDFDPVEGMLCMPNVKQRYMD
ncbi:uncharacterized protein [Physcomitrium patens]|uniref:TF-B3 domain-containing protein n=1 Tax=Physcomitrium patens TaxID=3218 RepID=A0A7I4FB79_PHYPA|nr:uncharacterized protein LOC112288836 isoform X2 [Physcomitrium patens]XP_024394994.1 uncharacterized protein LOC112291592 isoform X2 [Physcomitrium patens]|eukprot:XP_024389269.1 uncharacterized protein LOC112288836 isoform X2 [Physcomitrella patens]